MSYKKLIMENVSSLNYEVLVIIQHGSTTMDVAEDNSDIDFIAVVKEEVNREDKELPLITPKWGKIHITLFSKESFELLFKNFYAELAMKILDVNLLAGRLIHGKIIYDPLKLTEKFMEKHNISECPKWLIEKFVWQCFSFIKDAQHSNKYIKQNCIEKAIDSWGIAILLKKNVFTLNIKWQPILLERYLPGNIYISYIKLRFNYPNDKEEINSNLKNLIDYLRSEIDANQSCNSF